MHLDKHRDFPAFVARMKAAARTPATRRLQRARRDPRGRESGAQPAPRLRCTRLRGAARAAAMRGAGQRLPQVPGEIAPSL
ncbi:hypothetical protein [Sorangium sp. So ce861]|uniref:hypothetical protein n=1 Tax=Sorangium sp. So ce861 TaxID=3133323 RepID=UPI003F6028E0